MLNMLNTRENLLPARCASAYTAWKDGLRDSTAPKRPTKQYYEYVDADYARIDLSLWAKEIESYAEAFAGA
jgi:hypothetical protein